MKLSAATATLGLALCAACTMPPQETQIANPAATFCVEQGGTYTLRSSGTGGTCTLSDGRIVDAWEYFRANAARE